LLATTYISSIDIVIRSDCCYIDNHIDSTNSLKPNPCSINFLIRSRLDQEGQVPAGADPQAGGHHAAGQLQGRVPQGDPPV